MGKVCKTGGEGGGAAGGGGRRRRVGFRARLLRVARGFAIVVLVLGVAAWIWRGWLITQVETITLRALSGAGIHLGYDKAELLLGRQSLAFEGLVLYGDEGKEEAALELDRMVLRLDLGRLFAGRLEGAAVFDDSRLTLHEEEEEWLIEGLVGAVALSGGELRLDGLGARWGGLDVGIEGGWALGGGQGGSGGERGEVEGEPGAPEGGGQEREGGDLDLSWIGTVGRWVDIEERGGRLGLEVEVNGGGAREWPEVTLSMGGRDFLWRGQAIELLELEVDMGEDGLVEVARAVGKGLPGTVELSGRVALGEGMVEVDTIDVELDGAVVAELAGGLGEGVVVGGEPAVRGAGLRIDLGAPWASVGELEVSGVAWSGPAGAGGWREVEGLGGRVVAGGGALRVEDLAAVVGGEALELVASAWEDGVGRYGGDLRLAGAGGELVLELGFREEGSVLEVRGGHADMDLVRLARAAVGSAAGALDGVLMRRLSRLEFGEGEIPLGAPGEAELSLEWDEPLVVAWTGEGKEVEISELRGRLAMADGLVTMEELSGAWEEVGLAFFVRMGMVDGGEAAGGVLGVAGAEGALSARVRLEDEGKVVVIEQASSDLDLIKIAGQLPLDLGGALDGLRSAGAVQLSVAGGRIDLDDLGRSELRLEVAGLGLGYEGWKLSGVGGLVEVGGGDLTASGVAGRLNGMALAADLEVPGWTSAKGLTGRVVLGDGRGELRAWVGLGEGFRAVEIRELESDLDVAGALLALPLGLEGVLETIEGRGLPRLSGGGLIDLDHLEASEVEVDVAGLSMGYGGWELEGVSAKVLLRGGGLELRGLEGVVQGMGVTGDVVMKPLGAPELVEGELRVVRGEGELVARVSYGIGDRMLRVRGLRSSIDLVAVLQELPLELGLIEGWATERPGLVQGEFDLDLDELAKGRGRLVVGGGMGIDVRDSREGRGGELVRVRGLGLELTLGDGRLEVRGLQAQVDGGVVEGELGMGLADEALPWEGGVRVERLPMALLVPPGDEGEDGDQNGGGGGLLSLTFEGAGGRDLGSLEGRGRVQVAEGRFYQLPLLGPLNFFLGQISPEFARDTARDASASFEIAGGVLSTEDAKVESVTTVVRGSGDIDLGAGELDLRVRANLRGPVGVGTALVSLVLEIEVLGSFDEPKISLRNLGDVAGVLGLPVEAISMTLSQGGRVFDAAGNLTGDVLGAAGSVVRGVGGAGAGVVGGAGRALGRLIPGRGRGSGEEGEPEGDESGQGEGVDGGSGAEGEGGEGGER